MFVSFETPDDRPVFLAFYDYWEVSEETDWCSVSSDIPAGRRHGTRRGERYVETKNSNRIREGKHPDYKPTNSGQPDVPDCTS